MEKELFLTIQVVFVVSNLIGVDAMAAVTMSLPVETLIQLVGYCLGIGGSIAAGIMLGRSSAPFLVFLIKVAKLVCFSPYSGKSPICTRKSGSRCFLPLMRLSEALRQRITVHYNYAGLSDEEVSKYILHKLKLAGAAESIIDSAALAATHSFT